MPAQPSPASLPQRSAGILAGSLSSFTSASRPQALRTKSRADSWMSFCVESSERSIALAFRLLLFFRLQRSGLLPLRAADADAPRHDDALDVGGCARMQCRDRVALEVFHGAFQRPPALVFRQHVRPGDAQHALSNVEPGELAAKAVLRSFVGARLP